MNTKLIISCIGGTGALGGVVAGSYYLLNKESNKPQQVANTNNHQEQTVKETIPVSNPKKTLKELLAGTGFLALDTEGSEHNAHWKTLIGKYNEEGANKIVIDGGLVASPSDEHAANIKKLQTACTALLDNADGSESDKEIAKKWCNQKSTLIG